MASFPLPRTPSFFSYAGPRRYIIIGVFRRVSCSTHRPFPRSLNACFLASPISRKPRQPPTIRPLFCHSSPLTLPFHDRSLFCQYRVRLRSHVRAATPLIRRCQFVSLPVMASRMSPRHTTVQMPATFGCRLPLRAFLVTRPFPC